MEVLKQKMTYHDFKNMEFDDKDHAWYELINGDIVQKQSPTFEHQRISGEIEFELKSYDHRTKAGIVLHAPLDVFLDDNNVYHPDILFIKKDRYFIIDKKEQIVRGAPDLVIEILSKSTALYDKGAKKDTYEKYGVREYWLVDPKNKAIEIYALQEERFKLIDYIESTGILKSIVLENFEIDIEKIFKEVK